MSDLCWLLCLSGQSLGLTPFLDKPSGRLVPDNSEDTLVYYIVHIHVKPWSLSLGRTNDKITAGLQDPSRLDVPGLGGQDGAQARQEDSSSPGLPAGRALWVGGARRGRATGRRQGLVQVTLLATEVELGEGGGRRAQGSHRGNYRGRGRGEEGYVGGGWFRERE